MTAKSKGACDVAPFWAPAATMFPKPATEARATRPTETRCASCSAGERRGLLLRYGTLCPRTGWKEFSTIRTVTSRHPVGPLTGGLRAFLNDSSGPALRPTEPSAVGTRNDRQRRFETSLNRLKCANSSHWGMKSRTNSGGSRPDSVAMAAAPYRRRVIARLSISGAASWPATPQPRS